MNEFGFVQLPIEEYNRLYDASKELQKIKKDMVTIIEDYHKEPQIVVKVPLERMKESWDAVKDKYPDYELRSRRDEETAIYNAIGRKESEVDLI